MKVLYLSPLRFLFFELFTQSRLYLHPRGVSGTRARNYC
nr:MAG TPA: hypothetical protein [Caudoviricetes sp.]